MKPGFIWCVTASILCSTFFTSCKTVRSHSEVASENIGSGPYFRVWTGYRRRDITLQEFQTRWSSTERRNTQYHSLTPTAWSTNESLTRPYPDAVELDSYANEQDYLSQRANETQSLLDILEPIKSKNPQAMPLNGTVEAGEAYIVMNAAGPWTNQNVMPVFLQALQPQSFLASVSQYLQNQNAILRKCHLQGLIVACGTSYCTFWIHEVGTEHACSNLATDVQSFAKLIPAN